MAISALSALMLPWRKILFCVAAVAALVAVVLFYGESRAGGREEKVNARWEAAAAKLEEASEEAAAASDRPADRRAADYSKRLKQEKDRIDEIESAGGDPLDALFPSGV